MIVKIFGAPGTGKTTTIAKFVGELIEEGSAEKENIYGLSLTRAAKWRLIGKLDMHDFEKNILTLHSFAYRTFSAERGTKLHILNQKEIGEWFENKGFEYKIEERSEDFENAYPFAEFSECDGNRLYQLFVLLRLTMSFSEERFRAFVSRFYHYLPVSERNFRALYSDFIKWLKKEDVWDYTRLLTELYRRTDIELGGDVFIADESQDLAPLLAAIILRYLKNFKFVFIAGDDDQAIFTFAGATPDFLLKTKADKEIVLPKSYRLPKEVYKLALRIISKNRYRKKKNFSPREEDGKVKEVYSIEEALLEFDNKRTFVLTRNKHFLRDWVALLERYQIPYRFLGKKNTVPVFVKHLKTLYKLRKLKKCVAADEAFSLLRYLKLGRVKGTTQAKIAQVLAKAPAEGYSLHTPEGKVVEMLMTYPLDRIFVREDKKQLKKWIKRIDKIEEWENPKVLLSTIHSAKGLEAQRVILDTRITKKTRGELFENPEPERRVLYTAITRASEELVLCISDKLNYYSVGFM